MFISLVCGPFPDQNELSFRLSLDLDSDRSKTRLSGYIYRGPLTSRPGREVFGMTYLDTHVSCIVH